MEAAGIGEHGAVPVHETCEFRLRRSSDVCAGAEVEVVGVAEYDLGVDECEIFLGEGLHACLGTDGHEDGGFDGAVGGLDGACARGAVGVAGFDCEVERGQ